MASVVPSSSCYLERPAKKRKKFTRSATGCRSCRTQRVKCSEGPLAADGRKVTCKRCWETDAMCMYPTNGKSARKKGAMYDSQWERASEADYWASQGQDDRRDKGIISPSEDSDGWDLETLMRSAQTETAALPAMTTTTATIAEETIFEEQATDPSGPYSTDMALMCQPASTSTSYGTDISLVDPWPSSEGSYPASNSFLQWFMDLPQPSPQPMINSFSLTSVLAPNVAGSVRSVVSYFENEGCNEIVSASKSKHNWLFTHLFPRLFATLAVTPTGQDSVQGLMREWLRECFVQISYVHRGNVDADPGRALVWKSETDKARQRANRALLRAKMRFPNGQWKTEEYLMGFFVRCMAEMLSSNRLVIDDSTAFELPVESASPMYPILQDCIALYSTIDHASKAFGPDLRRQARFVMPPSGPHWVERFVGFSRQTIIRQGEVASLIYDRQSLLQTGATDGIGHRLLRTQAEKALAGLGNGWNWGEHEDDVGQPDRIRRGNGTMRAALQTLLLCEVFEVDVDDERLLQAKKLAVELVADAEASSLGGFQWALTILAVYTRDPDMRNRLQELIHHALSLSFGTGYVGTDEVLALCWEILDANGSYHRGIAPWREALAASERTIFL